jgi:hypothetical protein
MIPLNKFQVLSVNLTGIQKHYGPVVMNVETNRKYATRSGVSNLEPSETIFGWPRLAH